MFLQGVRPLQLVGFLVLLAVQELVQYILLLSERVSWQGAVCWLWERLAYATAVVCPAYSSFAGVVEHQTLGLQVYLQALPQEGEY